MNKVSRFSYFECKHILLRLEKFRDLIFYYSRYVGDDERASKPLDEYVDANLKAYEKYDKLKEQLAKLVNLVARDLYRAGIGFHLSEKEGDKEKSIDIFANLFSFLDDNKHGHKSFDFLIDIINRGIGVYEERKRIEYRRLYNPVYWISGILRLPLIIIQGVGLVSNEDAGKTFFKIYAGIIEILMLLILWLIMKKLGAHEAFKYLFRLIT